MGVIFSIQQLEHQCRQGVNPGVAGTNQRHVGPRSGQVESLAGAVLFGAERR